MHFYVLITYRYARIKKFVSILIGQLVKIEIELIIDILISD